MPLKISANFNGLEYLTDKYIEDQCIKKEKKGTLYQPLNRNDFEFYKQKS